ncbi:MAG: uL15 family ribosomal protein, partial [Burkholderiaceae bacterium]
SLAAGTVGEVRLSDLQKMDTEEIDLLSLKAARVISQLSLSARVILSGTIERKVSLKGIGATKGAKAAIEAAGGSVA